jgi:hypothetical protein
MISKMQWVVFKIFSPPAASMPWVHTGRELRAFYCLGVDNP